MAHEHESDCIIIGGGIAGLQAAIQLGRYRHRITVIDRGYGRSTLCRSYHNVLGWPEGVSGEQLRRLGRQHASSLGVQFVTGEAVQVKKEREDRFAVALSSSDDRYYAKKLLLATGVMDRFPLIPGLIPCLGLTVYVCPDCDGYEVTGRTTIVMGSGSTGANMSLTLSYWTDQIVYVNHEQKPIPENLMRSLSDAGIQVIAQPIRAVEAEESRFHGVHLEGGHFIGGERGFIAFGGNEVYSELAEQLGVERLENRHIVSNPRTMETNVHGVYVAGDVAVHAEQVTMAMGEGSIAAIWIHKALLELGSDVLRSRLE